jgi:hypothetical protein
VSLEIGPHVVAAFESEASKEEMLEFHAWWNSHLEILGRTISISEAESRLKDVRLQAHQVGLQDNNEARIFLQAAATYLIPDPTGEQWLLICDTIFEPSDDFVRLNELAAISRKAR